MSPAQENMSRRKQSHPKSIKKPDQPRTEGDDQLTYLPVDRLCLRQRPPTSDARIIDGRDYSVFAISALVAGTRFGPYPGRMVGEETEHNFAVQLSSDSNSNRYFAITSPEGAWLRLIREADDAGTAAEGARNCLIVIQYSRIWLEVTSDVAASAELIGSRSVVKDEPDDVTTPKNVLDVTRMCQAADGASAATTASVTVKVKVEAVSYAVEERLLPVLESTHTRDDEDLSRMYVCPLCGVRFSNASTLDAHVAHYCTGRTPQILVTAATTCATSRQSLSPGQKRVVATTATVNGLETVEDDDCHQPMKKRRRFSLVGATLSDGRNATFGDVNHRRRSSVDDDLSLTPVTTTTKEGLHLRKTEKETSRKIVDPDIVTDSCSKPFRCPHCSFVSAKRTNLHCHMRNMHRNPYKATTNSDEDQITIPQLYCAECKIQFSAVKTFNAHKTYYCGRRTSETSVEPLRVPEAPTPDAARTGQVTGVTKAPSSTAAIISHALVNPPVHLSTFLTGPLLLSNGHTSLSVPVMLQPVYLPSAIEAHANGIMVANAAKPHATGPCEQDQPLDLTVEGTKRKVKVKDEDERDEVESEPVCQFRRGYVARRDESGLQTRMDLQQSPPSRECGESSSGQELPTDDESPRQVYNICNDCKIVFYKFENYMIHKKYYCRGRRSDDADISVEALSTVAADAQLVGECKSPLVVSCAPCNITFKSQVTLEAHQQYYCPHRERMSQDDAPLSDDEATDTTTTNAMYICRKCGHEYATPKLFRMHFCDRGKYASSPAGGAGDAWSLHRCSRCNFVTHKETAFVEHKRKHASLKGYRCQLCGYKGNTVRGMRMHGKMMHHEQGEKFADLYLTEMHRSTADGADPIRTPDTLDTKPLSGAAVDADLESEIIRLKSEPYKRRRSKYKRNIENNVANSEAETPRKELCVSQEVTFKCNLCNVSFSGSSDEHMRQCHPMMEAAGTRERAINGLDKQEKTSDSDTGLTVKYEPDIDVCDETDNETTHDDLRAQVADLDPVDGDDKDANRTERPTPEKHQSNVNEKSAFRSSVVENGSVTGDLEVCAPTRDADADSDALSVRIKREIEPAPTTRDLLSVRDKATCILDKVAISTAPYDKRPTSVATSDHDRDNDDDDDSPPTPGVTATKERSAVRHCGDCNITFMYAYSYLAHKKYYCSARAFGPRQREVQFSPPIATVD